MASTAPIFASNRSCLGRLDAEHLHRGVGQIAFHPEFGRPGQRVRSDNPNDTPIMNSTRTAFHFAGEEILGIIPHVPMPFTHAQSSIHSKRQDMLPAFRSAPSCPQPAGPSTLKTLLTLKRCIANGYFS